MTIKVLDSWLREFLKTNAKPKQIAESLSLASVSVEEIEPLGNDSIYIIEVTTNRPELMSIVQLAKETSAILSETGIQAQFVPPKLTLEKDIPKETLIKVENDPQLVNRVLAVVLEVNISKSPTVIQKRLESTGIRSINNVVDITNYVMRTIGHPTHIFDFDRLNTKKIIIKKSKKGEVVKTLDDKTYT